VKKEAILKAINRIEDGIINLHYLPQVMRMMMKLEVRLIGIEAQLKRVVPAEQARAVCDNCKIDVILPQTDSDHAHDYIQNIGWIVRDDMTLCPGCVKTRGVSDAGKSE